MMVTSWGCDSGPKGPVLVLFGFRQANGETCGKKGLSGIDVEIEVIAYVGDKE